MGDEYQGCSHVETVPQRINDKMNEQAKGMTGCYTGKRRDRKRIVRNQHRMKATIGDS